MGDAAGADGPQLSSAGGFEEGEKIRAYHQGLIYEGKILRIENRLDPESSRLGERKLFFFLHYNGWKERWDEWVDESRILKYNEDNLKIQVALVFHFLKFELN